MTSAPPPSNWTGDVERSVTSLPFIDVYKGGSLTPHSLYDGTRRTSGLASDASVSELVVFVSTSLSDVCAPQDGGH